MLIVGVLGPDPVVAIAAISRQLVGEAGGSSFDGFTFHHDLSKDVLFLGLCFPPKAQEASQLRAALLLFLSCHAVVWVQAPGAPLDARMLGTLRLLQQAKQLLLPSLPELLGAAGAAGSVSDLPRPWGQPPLLLFVCQAPLGTAGALAPDQQALAQAKLDARLRLLFKRCRVVLGEEHPAALCTLRAQGMVWLLGALGQCAGAAVQQAFAALRGAAAGRDADPAAAQPVSVAAAGAGQSQPTPRPAGAVRDATGQGGSIHHAKADAAALEELRSALEQHSASTARASVGAGAGLGLPAWRRAFAALAAALRCEEAVGAAGAGPGRELQRQGAGPEVPEGATAASAWLAGCTGLLRQLSEARCQRALGTAREAYLRAVPDVYPEAVHAAALEAALQVYASLARGPASLEVQARLEAECEALWRDGRQQCQARSVWGRACTLPPHDPQGAPHSSGVFYHLATCDGQQVVAVADPFPDQAPALAPGVQPGPLTGPAGELRAPATAAAGSGSAAGAPAPAPSLLAAVPLLLLASTDAKAGFPGPERTLAQMALAPPPLGGGQSPGLSPSGLGGGGGVPSGSFLEVHVLGPSKAAQGGLAQPGLLPGASSLHRFALQLDHVAEPAEDFPALGPAQPTPSAGPDGPRVLNWPAGGAPAPAPPGPPVAAPVTQVSQGPGAKAPQQGGGGGGQGKKARKGPGGRGGAGPPALLVGVEYESLLGGGRAVVTPAQMSSWTETSLDPVVVAARAAAAAAAGGHPGGAGRGAPACPLTDALADAAAEAVGAAAAATRRAAAAAAAGAAQLGAAAGPAGPSPVAAPLGGPGAALVLASTLPLYVRCSPEQLGGSSSSGGSQGGKGSRGHKGHAAPAGAGAAAAAWWQLRRVFVATPAGELRFHACPLLRFEFPEGLPPGAPAPSDQAAQHAAGHGGLQGSPAAPTSLLYQPQQAVELPPDSLCCIALPWLYTVPGSRGGSSATAGPRGQGSGGNMEGAPAPAPLLMGMGPMRATLLGGTAVRPERQPG